MSSLMGLLSLFACSLGFAQTPPPFGINLKVDVPKHYEVSLSPYYELISNGGGECNLPNLDRKWTTPGQYEVSFPQEITTSNCKVGLLIFELKVKDVRVSHINFGPEIYKFKYDNAVGMTNYILQCRATSGKIDTDGNQGTYCSIKDLPTRNKVATFGSSQINISFKTLKQVTSVFDTQPVKVLKIPSKSREVRFYSFTDFNTGCVEGMRIPGGLDFGNQPDSNHYYNSLPDEPMENSYSCGDNMSGFSGCTERWCYMEFHNGTYPTFFYYDLEKFPVEKQLAAERCQKAKFGFYNEDFKIKILRQTPTYYASYCY